MPLAWLVDLLLHVELMVLTAFIQQCRVTTEGKAHLIGHPCTCIGRRDNWLHIDHNSIQIFYNLSRISTAMCSLSHPLHKWLGCHLVRWGGGTLIGGAAGQDALDEAGA
jgi:hypothetical protein